MIYKTSISILKKNKTHFNNILILSDNQLSKYNIFNYDLNIKNIILPILNINFNNIIYYINQYESTYTLENLYNLIVLNNYFSIESSNYQANEYICHFINNLDETNYWCNYSNCLLNITKTFSSRKFSCNPNRISDTNLSKIVKNIFNEENKNKNLLDTDTNHDYLFDMQKKNNFVDISNIIEKDKKYYYIESNTNFTKEDINRLFDSLNTDKQRYLLFSNLVITKKYCHLVVNNSYILTLMKDVIRKFAYLYRYLFGYAWLKFYSEECIKKSNVKTNDNFIFDINTASLLPIFPFNHAKPKDNPYMPILVSDQILNPFDNFCGLSDYISNDKKFCSIEEFRERLNIFCTGNKKNNIFENIDFQKYDIAITGSVMTGCIPFNHLLLSRFKKSPETDDKIFNELYNNYFDEYYAKSDIDIMFKTKDTTKFIDNVKDFYNELNINISKINNIDHKSSLILNKIGYLFVSEKFINQNIKNYDIKFIIDNINSNEIKDIFRPYYENLVKIKYDELIKDINIDIINKYPEIFICDANIDFRIYINQNEFINIDSSSYNKNLDIDLKYTYKYHIISPLLNRDLELFPIHYDDFFGVVSRFHMPVVRAYYNGLNVFMTPSCISAFVTDTNIDYKYIAGTKDPMDIISKNRLRGYGVYLNKNEINLITNYSKNVLFWNNLYSCLQNTNLKVCGPLDINHKFFRPRLYNADHYINYKYVETNNRYNNSNIGIPLYQIASKITDIIIKKFKCICNNEINYDKFQTIDSNGHINILKKYIILTTYELSI
jgi:hypothetical protein